MKKASFAALAFFAVLIFLSRGVALGAFVLIGGMAVLMAIADYFSARDLSKPPSNAERLFAYFWVWLRRAVCWPIGGLFVYRGVYDLLPSAAGRDTPSWSMSLFAILFGLLFIYIGFVGQGNTRSALRDDIRLHQENKRRYKLWF